MKIIGKTKNGVILEANDQEVANLAGYYYTGEKGFPGTDVGQEIKISTMYTYLREIMDNKKQIDEMVAKLRTAASLIETIPEPIKNIEVD